MSHPGKSQVSAVRSVLRLVASLLCAVLVAVLAPSIAWAEKGGLRCEEVTFPVTLSPSDPTVYEVFGVLCSRGSVHNKTIQVAIHGATYSHQYWDWPYQPETYSYMRQATAAGYAVLAIDRIGIGQSDRPPAEEVTTASNAYVVHQIVQALRGEELVVRAFGRIRADRVVLVGHSQGSITSIAEAATYGDVDGVVLTGLTHTLGPGVPELFASLYPASLDPRFAGQSIPDGYLTTLPGTRDDSFFYHAPFFDPQVVALDEQTKETVTAAELGDAISAIFLSSGIHVPVLVVVGDYDRIFCADPTCTASGTLTAEAAFYAPDACAEIVAIPDAGHNLNLHFQAPLTYDVILEWMDRRVGSNPRVAPAQPCEP
ncbi:MAG TPA: alpha/beta hydrolase [Thermoanaerobaculia bacterium]